MRSKLLILSLLVSIFFSFSAKAQEVYVPTMKGEIATVPKAVIMGTKTSGKSLLTLYGAKLHTSLLLDGPHSNNVLPKASAVFYVFIPNTISIQSFKLVPVKDKKKNRELRFMETGAYSGSKTKLEDIQLITEKITDELYSLRPIGDLKRGEYALAYIVNGAPAAVYDFRIEENLPPYPNVSNDVLMAEFYPQSNSEDSNTDKSEMSTAILRWYFDSDPRGARIFYRVISSVPDEVKNTNESYMTTTPLEETKALNIPGLTYENSSNVVIEIKVTKRGYEEQVKRYNVRQALDQQEISGFFELVEK